MTVEPGATEEVQLEYSMPAKFVSSDYTLLVQRQPGLELSGFEFTLQEQDGVAVEASNPRMADWPDSWRVYTDAEGDVEISVRLE